MSDGYFGMNGCLDRGRSFEDLAVDILTREGYSVSRSSIDVDIYQHIDFWAVGTDGERYSFDAKAMKSLSRGDVPQDQWAFVEWRGVTGHPGWLVKGCDILVFERAESIVLVRREDLLHFCSKKTSFLHVHRASESKYCMYSRVGRRDKISLFRFEDLTIPTRVFLK